MPCTTKSGRKGRSWLRRASSANWRRSSRENDHERYAGVVFEVQKGEARSTGEAGTLLQVYVNDYRMVGIGSGPLFCVIHGTCMTSNRTLLEFVLNSFPNKPEQAR